jgi:Tol biopolymer transport system component
VIVIRSVDAEEREVAPKLAHIERVRWAPDGLSLLVSGSDNKGRAGVYRVDARTAAIEPVVEEAGAGFRGFDGVWAKDGASVFYLHEGTELRRRHVSSGREATLYRAAGLHGIVRSPDGRAVAVRGENVIVLVPTRSGEVRRIPFDGVTEVAWSADLVAARGTDLWRVPLDGSAPEKLNAPGNRAPGFSLHPDGKRIALTAGRTGTEIWTMKLGGQ